MLKLVAPLSAASFAGGVIMPNLVPPVDSIERLVSYQNDISDAISSHEFEPFMTLFLKEYSLELLKSAKDKIIGIKLYPEGATTNSEGGVASIEAAKETLQIMSDLEIPLLVHGENPDAFVMDREKDFLKQYHELATEFPKLKIVMEHITTAEAVALLDEYENLYATVTLQHLLITLDDVAGGLLNPHLFCKPIAKRPEDRDALLNAALTAHPKLMFGSDSAPHPLHKKECCGCAAGVFTAPIALQILVELFEKHDALDKLQDFISDNAIRNYEIDVPDTTVNFVKKEFVIPDKYGDVVPMYAGQTIAWSIDG